MMLRLSGKLVSGVNIPLCCLGIGANGLGGKWKPILINAIYQTSPARFGELRRSVKGITQSMLTQQLRELEDDGIIKRKIYAEIPPRVEYTLTEFGLTLSPILVAMGKWGEEYRLKKKKA